MNERFINAYDKLSVNDKRNEMCNELMIIAEYIKYIESYLNYENNEFKIKNYNAVDDENKTESQILTNFYQSIFLIERELEVIINLLYLK